MKKRFLTSIFILLITALFIGTRVYTPYAFDVFVGLLAIMGCIEVTRALERKRFFTNIIFVGSFPAVMYIAMTIGILNKRDWLHFVLYFIVVILGLFLINFLYSLIFKYITKKEKDKYGVFESDVKYSFKKSMNSAFVMIYPALLFTCLFAMNHFFEFAFVNNLGMSDTDIIVIFFIVFTFAVTMLTDTFALLVGSSIGGPKLCPIISPNKTISGAIGGFVFGAIGGLLVYYLFSLNTIFSSAIHLFGFSWWKFLILAGVTSIVGQIGDLIASALKRSARVKDYGTIFPGHGGVMDRVDGLIFNSLVVLIGMFILI